MEDKIEVVFSFDTTGSMAACLEHVKRNLEKVAIDLFKETPNLKIGVCAHGDYCDANSTYVTRHLDLTSDVYTLTQFIRNTSRTGGGDAPECYELVLSESQTKYNWSLNSKKVLVVIGDATPHEPSYHLNKQRLDWRTEAKKLAALGVQIYTIQCLSRREANFFYEGLAEIGNGYRLELNQFTDILSLVNAVVYRQVSEERVKQYEETVVQRGGMNRSLDESFATLTGRPRDAKGRFTKVPTSGDLVPVDPGRFQMFNVTEEVEIRKFADDHSLIFQPGKGFYEFQKSEEIRTTREVVLVDRKTGDMYSGAKARDMIGVPMGTTKTISPRTMPTSVPYDIFIQSTSYNRKLKPGSRFMYEVDLTV
jgi:hypothetical protein